MPKFIDLTGKKIAYLTGVKYLGRNRLNKSIWELKCECGKKTTSTTNSILSGKKLSCGCKKAYTKEEYYNKVKKDILGKRKIVGECWEWQGYTFKGYGRRNFGQKKTKRKVEVHRISYMIYKGDIPMGMQVCHSCDNRSCFNPDHLWIGTQKDNLQDMSRKGRSSKFAEKLTEKDVREIRKRRNDGEKMTILSKEFCVHYQNIFLICHNKTWRHVK